MASSNSVNFSLSRNDILSRAFEIAGVIKAGVTLSAAQTTIGNQLLNMVVKQWSGTSDFSGIKMQNRKRAFLFLSKNNGVYTLGPTSTTTGTTDKWASSYVTTTIGTTEAGAQTVISLTSSTGISDTDRIGIALDDGTIHWSVVSGAPAGNDVTITNGLASQALAGNRVFAYATANQGRRPLSIITAALRDTSTVDTMLDPMLLQAYESITTKTGDGNPTRYYYEPTLTDGTLYLDYEPTDVTDVIRMVYRSPIEDFDGANDTPDFPQEWYLPFMLKTAMLACIAYVKPVPPELKSSYEEALIIARNTNPETTDIFFQSNT